MITYKEIINASRAFVTAPHHVIKNFGNGELWQLNDHNQIDNFEYPLMYMVDVPSSPGPKSWVYAFDVYFLSRVEAPTNRDGNPIYFEYTDQKSQMIACAQDFISYWVQDNNYKMTIDQSLGSETFIDFMQDGLSGCKISIRFVVPFTYDSCIIPMAGVPEPESLCLPVTLSLDTDVIASIASGDSYNITLKDQDGNPVSWSYNAPLKTLTIQTGGSCDPVTMTYNGVSIESTASGGTKTITVLSGALDEIGTIVVDTTGQLTILIANATIVNQSPGATWTDSVPAEGTYVLAPQPWTDSDGSAQSTPYDPDTPIVCTPAASYDPDAQAFFDAIGDVPDYAKDAINQRVLDFKSHLGGLSAVGMCYLFPPSRGMFEGWRELISNSIVGTQVHNTSNTVNPAPLYNFPRAFAGINGATYWDGGAFLSGFIPSVELTINDTAWAAVYPDTDIAQAAFDHGAFQSATQSMIFQKRSATNTCIADMYGNNVASGRLSYTSTGAPGVYIANRRNASDFKIHENGLEKDSLAATAGSLPTVPILFNGYKTNTTNSVGSNNNCAALCYYKISLTPTQVALETLSWQIFAANMNRTGVYLASVMADGDSHFAYWNSGFMREFHAQFWGFSMNMQNIAVSGQTVVQMNTNAATNLFPKIQAGRGDYYLICGGGTNDISAGASAATVWADMQTCVANAKANASGKGITLHAIHIPLYNRRYTGNDAAILRQDEYNELVRNNFAVGDYYVDFPAEYSAKLSDYGGNTAVFIDAVRDFADDTNYFHDGTHLIDGPLGYPVPAALVAAELKTILGI